MFCPKCSNRLDDGALFCGSCGYDLRNPIAGSPAYAPPVKKKKSGFLIAWIIIIAVICVSAGVIVATLNRSNEDNDSSYSSDNKKEEKETEPNKETKENNGTDTQETTSSEGEQVADLDEYTVMIYMVASSLEYDSNTGKQKSWATRDVAEILAADIPDTTNVILECGGTQYWENPDIPDGAVTRFSVENKALNQLENLGKTSMTNTGDLSNFIKYCEKNFPAKKYVLVLWDHGGGYPLSFGVDYLDSTGNGYDACELGEELKNGGVHFDSLVFNACLMGSLEVCMSVKDYVDNMIGAESVVYAPDIEYTNFLTKIEDSTPYLETIIRDYEKQIEESGLASSMSVISLKHIDEVYEAYIQYLNEVKAKITTGDYYNFVAARENTGEYSGTMCVDLVTLANLYPTDSSTKLINKITNCINYTFSNIAYGRGLTVLFPYPETQIDDSGNKTITMKKYDLCRESFEKIGYDKQIVDFFDTYMSMVYVANDFKTSDKTWYISQAGSLINHVTGENIVLALKDAGGYNILDIDPSIVKYSYLSIFIKMEEGDSYYYYNLGSEYKKVVDSNGNYSLVIPKTWLKISDRFATHNCVSHTVDSDGVITEYYEVYAKVNNQDAKIRIFSENKGGNRSYKLLGYRVADFANGTISDSLTEFKSTDEIVLIHRDREADGTYSYYTLNADEPLLPSQITMEWKTLNQNSTAVWYGKYTLIDIYGNTYVTDGYYKLVKNDTMK